MHDVLIPSVSSKQLPPQLRIVPWSRRGVVRTKLDGPLQYKPEVVVWREVSEFRAQGVGEAISSLGINGRLGSSCISILELVFFSLCPVNPCLGESHCPVETCTFHANLLNSKYYLVMNLINKPAY